MLEQYDTKEGYCGMLGHFVRFSYCRAGTGPFPCVRIADCWYERIPIDDFLCRHYTQDELRSIFAPGPGKIESILAIVQRLNNTSTSSRA
jgi:hypothetical protein